MSWSGWGTKLNVTSIVSQGLEQVRSLREDVEKSFDQAVTGAPGSRVSLPISAGSRTTQDEAEEKVEDPAEFEERKEEKAELEVVDSSRKSVETDGGVKEALEEAVERTEMQEEDAEEQDRIQDQDQDQDLQDLQDEEQEQEQKQGQAPQDEELQDRDPVDADMEQDTEEVEDEETEAKVEEEDSETEDIETGAADVTEVVESEVESGEIEADVDQEDEPAVTENTSVKKLDMAALNKELEMRESQLLATSTTIRELHDELDKTCHREVAAVERAQYLTEQLELMRREVTKLTQLHHETSNNQSADVQALQMALAEKEEKLSALLDEGQALSVKQAQYEQRLRSLRKEKDELEERALKSQSQYDASTVEVKELFAKLKVIEEEKARLARENRQLTTSTETTASKVEKVEQEAREATEQLEKLQAQVEQLTLDVTRKSEEIENLKTATQSNETLNVEKTELQQTLHFLQENVRDLEQEAARREEMARTEIADLKRKWQDAVARVDMLGQSLQQRLRLREGENRMLKQQLESLEARQKQTTDEIVRLSTRNALLESGEAQREQTQLALAKLQKHQVVLLELFGEKEEQVEELQAENRHTKKTNDKTSEYNF
ncbi:hypothetical protein JM18_006751 [Phytophthora kernoviae]|uniref:TATA element modulatory factor 1 TATA binding domain-containing protein n=2 Tax=Phytophthora kernoviae TaxID=325452 RepID=A0A8T0LQJ3_9STRA|nr:hypothetical protein G195_011299 [Phytophthora kernoviae 00238/432]KAG2518521.1 hypothetical protein JM16_006833 [Phytophthora kernoviae]KAG2520174.1 hypothetical protein JM18_006751 [Phytophthora kernoviae]